MLIPKHIKQKINNNRIMLEKIKNNTKVIENWICKKLDVDECPEEFIYSISYGEVENFELVAGRVMQYVNTNNTQKKYDTMRHKS